MPPSVLRPDATVANADWPKRTPDRMDDISGPPGLHPVARRVAAEDTARESRIVDAVKRAAEARIAAPTSRAAAVDSTLLDAMAMAAMLAAIERKAGDARAAQTAVASLAAWRADWRNAVKEWQAAELAGGSTALPAQTMDAIVRSPALTDAERRAYAARTEFIRRRLGRQGKTVTLWRALARDDARRAIPGQPMRLLVWALSSWSGSRAYAASVARASGIGLLARATVPVSAVWAVGAWRGLRPEPSAEYVILSRRPSIVVAVERAEVLT